MTEWKGSRRASLFTHILQKDYMKLIDKKTFCRYNGCKMWGLYALI